MKILSNSKKLLLELLLKDHRISSEILLNGEVPAYIKVHDDGSVTFGRTKKGFWNWLFKDEKRYEFRELSTMMLAAYSKYLPPNEYLSNILTKNIIEDAYKKHDYESVIDRFALYAFLGVTEGDYVIDKIKLIDEDTQQQQKKNVRGRRIGNTIGYLDLGGGSLPVGISIVENDLISFMNKYLQMDAYSYLRLNKLIRRVIKYFIQVKKLDVNTSL